MRRPILNFFPLILGVLSNTTPGSIHGSPWVTQTLSKESLELNPRQGGHSFGLVPTLVLVPTKADPTTKKQSCKWGMVGAGSAGRIYRSDLHTSRWPAVSGRLAWAWRNESMQNLSSSEGLPRCTWRWGEVPYSEESPRASGFLCQAERGKGESRVPSLRSLVLSNWASPNGLADPLGLEQLEL